MSPLRTKLQYRLHTNPAAEECNRKKQLIKTVSVELLTIGFLLICFNIYLHFWFVSYILITGCGIILFNLFLMNRKFNITLCAHILNLICLSIMILGNIWVGGVSSSSVSWFYISPIIAAATIGLEGLVLYGLASLCIIIFFFSDVFSPVYHVPLNYIPLINNINHIFIFLLIFTTLYSLLKDSRLFEKLLNEQNFLLSADRQKFHYLSNHDSLTNLPNRSYFNNYFQHMLDSTNTEINAVTLYYMDLDGFKQINDQYGHEVGDILLLQVGKRLLSSFRSKDFIARLGGDEFTAIITHNIHDDIDIALFQRIENEFKTPFNIKNQQIHCSISIGMANYPSDSLNADTLLQIADEAMYKNKQLYYSKLQS